MVRTSIGLVVVALGLSQGAFAEDSCRLTTYPHDEFFSDQKHPLLELPEVFKKGRLEDWKKAAVTNKTPFVEFKSHLEDNRVVILDGQGPLYDRWILVVDRGQIVDIIVTEKKQSGAAKSKIWFAEYKPVPTYDEKTGIGGWGALTRRESPKEACYQCHANGLREINPLAGSAKTLKIPSLDPKAMTLAALAQQRIKDFNSRMRDIGYPDWRGTYQPERRFPPMGANFSGKQDCTQCHDGRQRGILTPLLNTPEYLHKIIESKSMPPKSAGLSKSARANLYDSLFVSYLPELERWMSEHPPCKKADPIPAPGPTPEPSVEEADPTKKAYDNLIEWLTRIGGKPSQVKEEPYEGE